MSWKRLGNQPIDYSYKKEDDFRIVVTLSRASGFDEYSFSINEGYHSLHSGKLTAKNIDDAEQEADQKFLNWKK